MMSGVPLKACWAFNILWNDKFYYKAAFCMVFLLSHNTMHVSMNIKFRMFLVVMSLALNARNQSAALPKYSIYWGLHAEQIVVWGVNTAFALGPNKITQNKHGDDPLVISRNRKQRGKTVRVITSKPTVWGETHLCHGNWTQDTRHTSNYSSDIDQHETSLPHDSV
jgi:hypothetical protein